MATEADGAMSLGGRESAATTLLFLTLAAIPRRLSHLPPPLPLHLLLSPHPSLDGNRRHCREILNPMKKLLRADNLLRLFHS